MYIKEYMEKIGKIAVSDKHIIKVSKVSLDCLYGFDLITEKYTSIPVSKAILDPEWIKNGLFLPKTIAMILQLLRQENKNSSIFKNFNITERTYRRYLREYCDITYIEEWKNIIFTDKNCKEYKIKGKELDRFLVELKYGCTPKDENFPKISAVKDNLFYITERNLNKKIEEGYFKIKSINKIN